MGEDNPLDKTLRPAPRPWRRRVLRLLVCLGLAALIFEPLLLAMLPRLARPYINGRVTVRDIEWQLTERSVILRGLTLADTAGQTLLTAERVRLQVARSPLRLGAVEIDSAALQVNLADGAAVWRSLLPERAAADTGPVQLPDLITARARLDLRSETWTRTVGLELQTGQADGVTRGRIKLRDLTSGRAEITATGNWLAATGELAGLTVAGGLRGDSTTLVLAALADYAPERGLQLRAARVSDGIDTISVSGVCCSDSTLLVLQARDFSFGARYPEIPWASGELLDLSLQGNQQRVRVSGNFRAGRSNFSVRGEVEPAARRARLEQAGGWLAAFGNFTASGEAWQDAATAAWHWRDASLTADRFPLALAGCDGTWSDSGEITASARSFRYERYLLEQPAGAAIWQDDVLVVSHLAAHGLDGALAAQGDIGFVPVRGDIKVYADRLRLAAIDRMFRREFGTQCALDAGVISGEVGVQWGDGWRVTLRQLQVAGATVRPSDLGTVTGLTAAGELDLDGRALTFRRLHCRGLGGTIGLQGKLAWSGESSLQVTARDLALTQVDTLLRAALARQELTLSAGTVHVAGTVRFNGENWSLNLPAVTLAGAAVQYAPLGSCRDIALQTGLELSPQRLTLHNLRGTLLGGTVTADGSVQRTGSHRMTVAVADVKLAEIDTLFRAKLARRTLRLLDGTLHAGLVLTSGEAGWEAATTQPLELRTVRLSKKETGTMANLALTLDGSISAAALVVRQATVKVPGGELRGSARLTGSEYSTLSDGRLTFAGLNLAEAQAPLVQLMQPYARLSSIAGLLDGEVNFATGADSGLATTGFVNLTGVNLQMSDPVLVIDNLHGRVPLTAAGGEALEFRGFRQEEFALGWQALAEVPAPNLFCTTLALGNIAVRNLELEVGAAWPRLTVNGSRWNMFTGSGRARGFVSFAGPGRCAFTVLVSELSSRAVCAGFPGIENYLTGKVNATVWLKSDTLAADALKGLSTAWMHGVEDERMAIHKNLLIRLAGESLRRQIELQPEYLPLDTGELTTRLEGGKMTFETLRLEVNTLFFKARVGVVEGRNRIGLRNFLGSISAIPLRGTQVDFE